MNKRVALISLGCAKNLVDSEVMLGCLKESGYSIVVDLDVADCIIVNTCGFIRPAKDEAVDHLNKAIRLKQKNRQTKIIAAGCFVERYKKALVKSYPEVDAWMGVREFDKIVQVLESKRIRKRKQSFLLNQDTPRLLSTPRGWTYLKISEGCSHPCSFCAIPLIKGPYRSRNVDSIREEAGNLALRGVKELNLVSQDTTSYGRDLGIKEGLTSLLRCLLEVKGIEWIRILYGYPEEINDSLLEIMKEKKICPYLDIPFQHSVPRIIRRMKRGMDGRKALQFIEKIRKKLPGVALRTSLIVGFPGEGREEFDRLKKFVREAEFDHLGVFTYSKEEGTEAYSFKDPIPEEEKNRRRDEIMAVQAGISLIHNRKRLGRKINCLIEGTVKGRKELLLGRASFQAPEVDGVVIITKPAGFRDDIAGTIRRVEITEADAYDLRGRMVP